jgi:uncharacterized phiE125 gp8 family phage protein
MTLSPVVAPTEEPVTVLEAKQALRLDVVSNDEDEFVEARIGAARSVLSGPEGYTKRQLVTATWRLGLAAFPAGSRPIVLPLPPLREVTAIQYVDVDGQLQTWEASKYQVVAPDPAPSGTYPEDAPRGRIYPAYGETYPSTRDVPDAVRVTFLCGYGTPAEVPGLFKTAILLVVGELYKHREETVTGTIVAKVPLAAKTLLFGVRDRERLEAA